MSLLLEIALISTTAAFIITVISQKTKSYSLSVLLLNTATWLISFCFWVALAVSVGNSIMMWVIAGFTGATFLGFVWVLNKWLTKFCGD